LPSIPQCAGSISAQQLQHANTWPRRTLQHANTSTTSTSWYEDFDNNARVSFLAFRCGYIVNQEGNILQGIIVTIAE
jgi:hypothetical protein